MKFKSFLVLFFLLMASLAGFGPGVEGSFLFWDDNINIFDCVTLVTPDALWRIWFSFEMPSYLPVTDTFWWLQVKLFGNSQASAPWFHGVSLVFHFFNACLCWLLLRRIDVGERIAFAAALLWMIHPWKTESVAWVTDQKSLFSTFFILLAWLSFPGKVQEEKKPFASHLPWLVFYLLSILAKPSTILVPVLFFMRFSPGETFSLNRSRMLAVAAFLVIAGGVAGITVWRETFFQAPKNSTGIRFSRIESVFLCARTHLYYWSRFAAPPAWNFQYPKWETGISLHNVGTLVIYGAIVGFSIWQVARGFGGIAFAVLGSVLSSLPTSGLVGMPYLQYSFVSDRYQYFGSLFLVLFMLLGGRWLFVTIMKSERVPGWAFCFLLPILLGWGLQARANCAVWRDTETFWASAHGLDPAVMHTNIAIALEHQGNLEGATGRYERALAQNPRFTTALVNLGAIHHRSGDPEGAESLYRRVVEVDPDHVFALSNLGAILMESRREGEAEKMFLKAIQLFPAYPDPWHNLGLLVFRRGDHAQAAKFVRRALRLKPGFAPYEESLRVIDGGGGK